ncbi:phage holin family protein [Pedobacter sp. MC2016-24]|uniref:phage holin family protein n=1 Tax=Pedobacter sp. MC2016-24 TaxID=2780090 RepID=UPI00187FB32D|nr:phage holin family protein [Pedobacter sp. MC2016-24]MBE9600609.1 phage holin family protein [Pedobacter sp. MC2016-24]
MEDNKEKDLKDLFDDAKSYLDTRVEYTRLYLVEQVSKIFADIVTNAAVIICFILAFLFGTFTLALFLSDVLGSYARGFGCVAVIYVLLALIVYYTKEKFIEKAIINFTIKNYFNKLVDKEEEEDEQKV